MLQYLIFYNVLEDDDIKVPKIACSSQSNGNLGVLNYYDHDDHYVGKVTSYYRKSSSNSHHWHWIAGSFCPKVSGYYEIKSKAWPAIYTKFVNQHQKDRGDECTGWKEKSFNQYLYANRCYPYTIADENNCVTDRIEGYLNGTLIDSTSTTIMDCYTEDCLPGYYTDTCSQYNDAYCNEHGSLEYGRESDGLGCTCNSFSDNIFCEDTSQYVFPEGKRGVVYTSYYNDSTTDSYQVYEDFSMKEFSESYSTIELNSILYVPQNTDLQFQLKSIPKAELYIDGNLVVGSLDDRFDCEEKGESVVTTPRQYFTRGNHYIKIKLLPGCAMYNQCISLKWKFYRWYRNNPSDFQDIPARYLGFN
ncbi:hypothetical protein TVAG_162020 [Trichomonas vaginalis G3]|uniref:PA14 domain-containing protein n=1 Tax=Trichomonas vaginalis (strain ATCC PRA-98 / G3) TaxID=412133 RepID=A2FBV0_TRIV3|nr:hypothetical protein TVAGG3_0721070 [Trichomonas vaginalis G3]EAX97596.1 hypothetical protein TVAG_162020 [Trichomonas vaginalis G3]KAI5510592.1 hypothetical protein TVAGG3_0721070 [Trichomonas vaginalis G3]|eukprot:XP_001310526.1 hypothetical protein [Trichomonas vaginalis G3]